jgi:uncharacterized protein YjbI with pentapeptide repeats
VTWFHRALIVLDLLFLLILWRGALEAQWDIAWRGLVKQHKALTTTIPLAVFSIFIVSFPGERHTNWLRFGSAVPSECNDLFPVGIFPDRLSLPRESLIDTDTLAKIETAAKAIGQTTGGGEPTRHFEGRDLSCGQFVGADLRRADLSGTTNLRGASLREAQLQGTNLSFADLRDANLSLAQLQGTKLTGARMQGANLEFTDLRGAMLKCENRRVGMTPDDCVKLQGAMLKGAQLQGLILGGAHLEGANLGGANLEGAWLSNAHLEGAWLAFANLQNVCLIYADLEGAWLKHAVLTGADLNHVQLQGATLEDARVDGALLGRVFAWRADVRKSGVNAGGQGVSVVGPYTDRKFREGDWTADSFAKLMRRIEEEVPKGDRRESALKWIANLDPAKPLDEEEEMAKAWVGLEKNAPPAATFNSACDRW